MNTAALDDIRILDAGAATEDLSAEELAALIRRVEMLEKLLDRQFRLPVIGFPVGLDGLLGLIPVAGDTVTGALSAFIVWEAHRAGVDRATKAKMIRNIGVDYVIGLVPVIGWVADFLHKANTKNLRLLKGYLVEKGAIARA